MTSTTTGKPGLVVTGVDFCARGSEFEALHRSLDG